MFLIERVGNQESLTNRKSCDKNNKRSIKQLSKNLGHTQINSSMSIPVNKNHVDLTQNLLP